MNDKQDAVREKLSQIFDDAFAPDSLSGGIIRAARPNKSTEWDEDKDRERNRSNADSFVENSDQAVKILASRK